MKVLHDMSRHGLGDNVMFSAVLAHLQQHRPDWQNSVLTHYGKHTCFNHGVTSSADGWDEKFEHRWRESLGSYTNLPGTKAVRCLKEVFGIHPDWELLRYKIDVSKEAERKAKEYEDTLPLLPFMLIHYQGESSPHKKNLEHHEVRAVCDWLIAQQMTPVIIDFNHRSTLPDNKRIFRAAIPKDAEVMAALVNRAALFLGIDSGPSKIAYGTSTPTLTVWTGMHPYHYCDNAPNAFHLVPINHESLMRGNREQALKFFREHYRHEEYQRETLPQHIIIRIAKMLNIKIEHMNNLLKTTVYDASYYFEHKLAGLDYLNYGDWQKNYGKWFVESLGLKGMMVLDVGCACGAIACGFAHAGAFVSGIDPNEHMIRLGREKWLASTLKIGDAVNLHFWKDGTFDFIHSAQVFEHFKPELVPFILRELRRVLKDDGRMFFALDTTELYERQNRKIENEDATHTCVKPLEWWLERLTETGWSIDFDTAEKLKKHPDNYFQHHDWDWLAIRKNNE